MAALVSADWVAGQLGMPGRLVIDTRPAMRHLMGHLKSAVNVPPRKLRDARGRLLPPEDLANLFGAAGLGDGDSPVLYDGYDGRDAAMAAWVLEYLGRDDVRIMDVVYDEWKAQGREVFYRPAAPKAAQFTMRVNPAIRATLADIPYESGESAITLVDSRSREEYRGEMGGDENPGHIPGAVNVAWQELVGRNGWLTCSPETTREVFDAANIGPNDRIITYCQVGARAAVSYLALKRLGYDVRLYDASKAEWEQSGLPVEK